MLWISRFGVHMCSYFFFIVTSRIPSLSICAFCVTSSAVKFCPAYTHLSSSAFSISLRSWYTFKPLSSLAARLLQNCLQRFRVLLAFCNLSCSCVGSFGILSYYVVLTPSFVTVLRCGILNCNWVILWSEGISK